MTINLKFNLVDSEIKKKLSQNIKIILNKRNILLITDKVIFEGFKNYTVIIMTNDNITYKV